MNRNKEAVNFRIPPEVREMLARLAAFSGGSQAVIIEQLIREAFHRDEEAIERAEKKKAGRQG